MFQDGVDVQWLACGHCYHKECIDEYCQVLGTPLEGIRCPECRKGFDDINGKHENLNKGQDDNDIAKLLRRFTDRPTIHMAIVLASSPDLVEAEWRDLRIVASEGDAGRVSLTLSRAPIEDETVPLDRFTRDRFPALFR